MPITTGRISLRDTGALNTRILDAVKNFILNSGNYTLVTNQPGSYFVVKSTRNTGFAGDAIVAQIGMTSRSYLNYGVTAYLYIIPWESWSGTTGTNAGITVTNVSATNSALHYEQDHTWYGSNSDIFISCDDTFILMTHRMYTNSFNNESVHSYNTFCNSPVGVVSIERLPGDNDTGTFYGHFGREQVDSIITVHNRIYVPKRFDGATANSAFYNIGTVFGNTSYGSGKPFGLYGRDESGNHICFDIYAHLASSGRFKGQINGLKAMPIGRNFGHLDTFTDLNGKKYMFGKLAYPQHHGGIAMEIAPTITNIYSQPPQSTLTPESSYIPITNASFIASHGTINIIDSYGFSWEANTSLTNGMNVLIDLKDQKNFYALELSAAASPQAEVTFSAQGSLDGNNWIDLGTARTYGYETTIANEFGFIQLPQQQSFRYLRITPLTWGSAWVNFKRVQLRSI